MRILHVCLTGPFTNGFQYQENLIIKEHKKQNQNTCAIGTTDAYNSKGELISVRPGIYEYENGVRFVRLSYVNYFPLVISRKLRLYKGLYAELVRAKPDVIFIHDVQFLDIFTIVKYLRKNNRVEVFVDGHADFSNSARNWLSRNVLHKIIYKKCAKAIEPFTSKFYGTLPVRVDFMVDVYDLPANKCELLVMGADDDLVEEALKPSARANIRQQYGVEDDDFLIVSGGKIDIPKKQTLNLMQAVKQIVNPKVKLLVFGSIIPELKEEFNSLLIENKVIYAGWLNAEGTYKHFAASDLVVFPGRHSVFWEQVVALGVPMVVKEWEGTKHIDIGGNVVYLKEDSVYELSEVLNNLIFENNLYADMCVAAKSDRRKEFLYSTIAKKSIQGVEIKGQ
jgi:glycosyltransferase involved in cell wall biosynthesis